MAARSTPCSSKSYPRWTRQPRRARTRDGGGCELQRRVGGARRADLALDVHMASPITWQARTLGDRLGVGSKVKRWKVGDEVVIHCNQDDGDDEECNGGDPMFSRPSASGVTRPRTARSRNSAGAGPPARCRALNTSRWEESASYTLTLATAYRMLFGMSPNALKPGENVLVWGARGGLGVFGVQLCGVAGAQRHRRRSPTRRSGLRQSLGARGHQPQGFQLLGPIAEGELAPNSTPTWRRPGSSERRSGSITASKDVDIVFEHPGEATFPNLRASCASAAAWSSLRRHNGFNLTFDARFVWMRQKRIQGSHFAHLNQAAAANQFVIDPRIDPASGVFPWEDSPSRTKRCRITNTRRATWRCWS